MATVTPIQLLNRIGTAGAPPSLLAGELAYNQPDTNDPTAPGDVLYAGDGINVNTLVGAARQVELAGAQTITGIKTIDVSGLKILGGGQGYLLETDGSGNLTWTNAPGGGLTQVAANDTLSGTGTSVDPLGVVGETVAVATDGVTIDGNGLTATPLAAIKWPIVVDGTTIAGTGLAGGALHVMGGTTAVTSDGTTITGNGLPADPLVAVRQTGPVATDGVTLSGNGETGSPLAVVPDTVAVATNSTLTGNGTTASPLGVVAGNVSVATNSQFSGNGTTASPLAIVANSVPVLTDNSTLVGTGVTGSPLSIRQVYTNTSLSGAGTSASPLAVVAGSLAGTVSVVTDGVTLSGNGLTATPLAVVKLPTARQIGIVATGGTTITETPASFDGSANVNITGFEVTNLDCGTY